MPLNIMQCSAADQPAPMSAVKGTAKPDERRRTQALQGTRHRRDPLSVRSDLEFARLRSSPPVALLATAVFFGGTVKAMAAMAFASMMADAAEEHEHLFGARRESLYFAGWAFARV
jgi:hypothetical protein